MSATPDCPYGFGGDRWQGAAKVVEEGSELLTVIAKLIATGGSTDYFDGTDLRARLLEEIADLRAALQLFETVNLTLAERSQITSRLNHKYTLFRTWLRYDLPAIDHRCKDCDDGGLMLGHCLSIDGDYWHICEAVLRDIDAHRDAVGLPTRGAAPGETTT